MLLFHVMYSYIPTWQRSNLVHPYAGTILPNYQWLTLITSISNLWKSSQNFALQLDPSSNQLVCYRRSYVKVLQSKYGESIWFYQGEDCEIEQLENDTHYANRAEGHVVIIKSDLKEVDRIMIPWYYAAERSSNFYQVHLEIYTNLRTSPYNKTDWSWDRYFSNSRSQVVWIGVLPWPWNQLPFRLKD